MTRVAILIAALVATLPLTATAELAIRPDDQARLGRLDEATRQATAELAAHGDAAQRARAAAVLTGQGIPFDAAAARNLAGDWACRMTKLGGNLPEVSYPPFRCRITVEGDAIRFEKLTGSQRTRGTLQQQGGRWVYLGSSFVAGEAPLAYDAFPRTLDTHAGETLPDVGVFQTTGTNRARILFPLPYRESLLNVLTLTR